MNSMAVIYNIAGLSERDNDEYYIKAIQSIIDQNFTNYKLIISSCLNTQNTIDHLLQIFNQKISINWIHDKIPINCSFNFSTLKTIEKFGEFDCICYIDSGCNLINNPNVLKDLYELYQSGPYSLVTGRTNTDTGFPNWGICPGRDDNDSESFNDFFKKNGHYIVPIGKCCNLHFQLFGNKLIKEYKQPLVDLWAGQASESVLSFLTAAINQKWIIHSKVEIEHITGLDIPSCGFSPIKWRYETNRPCWDHPFKIDSILPRIRGGLKYGLGYQEIEQIALHDPSKFDSDGYALCPELKDYIRDNLFLNISEFDYSKIKSIWL